MPATVEISGQTFNVVGTYQSTDIGTFLSLPLISEDAFYKLSFDNLGPNQSVYLFSDNASLLINELPSSLNPINTLSQTLSETRANNINQSIGLFIFTLIALGASALSFYFIVRSSLIQRVRDIGIYRSLGIRSFDILKLFLAEAVILTTVTSLIGYLGMTYILNQIQQATQEVVEVISVSLVSLVLGILFIYTVNVLSGLFPVFNLLRKTPSTIMTKYDI
jgi:ABC-type antimicrobial peptide transport system permease subunit